jgi:hypothetical protein
MSAKRWACARCGAKNAGGIARCASCGLLRGSVVVASAPSAPIPGSAPSTRKRAADFPNPPADPAAIVLMAPFLVPAYARARVRERGGGAARRAVLVTAVGSPIIVAILAWTTTSGQEALFLPVAILGPLLLGVVAAIAIPGVAGWAFAVIGLALGGIAVGVGLWVGVAIGAVDMGQDVPFGLLEALVYIVFMAILVPILMGAQVGVGVFIGSGLAGFRRRLG